MSDQYWADAVRVGCKAANVHLTCTYPDCSCNQIPTAIVAALRSVAAPSPKTYEAGREAGLREAAAIARKARDLAVTDQKLAGADEIEKSILAKLTNEPEKPGFLAALREAFTPCYIGESEPEPDDVTPAATDQLRQEAAEIMSRGNWTAPPFPPSGAHHRSKRNAELDHNGFEYHLQALRNANDGWAITIWRGGDWKLWRTLDAKYAQDDPEIIASLDGDLVQEEIDALAKTGHPMKKWRSPPSGARDDGADELEIVARAIDKARYGPDYPDELRKSLEEEDKPSRDYAFRLARAAIAALHTPNDALERARVEGAEAERVALADGADSRAAFLEDLDVPHKDKNVYAASFLRLYAKRIRSRSAKPGGEAR